MAERLCFHKLDGFSRSLKIREDGTSTEMGEKNLAPCSLEYADRPEVPFGTVKEIVSFRTHRTARVRHRDPEQGCDDASPDVVLGCKLGKMPDSVASALVSSGVSERILPEILGHKSIRITMDTYNRLGIETQQQGTGTLTRLLGFDKTG